MSQPPDKDALRDEDPVQLGRDSPSSIPVVRPAEGADPAGSDPGRPPAFWQALIDRRETVLWFGAPDPTTARGARTQPGGPVMLGLCAVGLVAGLALLINQQTDGFGIKAAGMALFTLSGLMLARALNFGAKRMAEMHYLLTDRAAYIARVRPGSAPTVQRHDITPRLPVSATQTSVTFAVGVRRRKDEPETPILAGFYNIRDAAEVRTLIRGIQKGMK